MNTISNIMSLIGAVATVLVLRATDHDTAFYGYFGGLIGGLVFGITTSILTKDDRDE